MESTTLEIAGKRYDAIKIKTQKAAVLLIKGRNGMLGCGYLDVATADKLGEALAVVTGVKNFDDMLAAACVKVSCSAMKLGVECGMSGREALAKMN